MSWSGRKAPAGILYNQKQINPTVKMKKENRKKTENFNKPSAKERLAAKIWLAAFTVVVAVMLCDSYEAMAQDGNAGISQATSQIKGYFSTGTSLMYAIGAIVGLIGAVKVYNKWSAGEPDTAKVASSWFGACIFLVIVATVLKSFFGV